VVDLRCELSQWRMNPLLILLVAAETIVYALLWHNKPARPQKEESLNPERELLWSSRCARLRKPGQPRENGVAGEEQPK